MKYYMHPVIFCSELEEEIKLQYDIDLSIDYLFFSYTDNELEYLGINKDWDIFEYDDEDGARRKLVRQHLRDIMPEGTDTVIIEM